MRSLGQGATASAGDASGRLETEIRSAETPMAGGIRAGTSPSCSLLGGPVLNGMNTGRLLALGVSGTYSASAVHGDLGSRGSGTHRDSKRTFPMPWHQKVQERSWRDGSGALSLGL